MSYCTLDGNKNSEVLCESLFLKTYEGKEYYDCLCKYNKRVQVVTRHSNIKYVNSIKSPKWCPIKQNKTEEKE